MFSQYWIRQALVSGKTRANCAQIGDGFKLAPVVVRYDTSGQQPRQGGGRTGEQAQIEVNRLAFRKKGASAAVEIHLRDGLARQDPHVALHQLRLDLVDYFGKTSPDVTKLFPAAAWRRELARVWIRAQSQAMETEFQ